MTDDDRTTPAEERAARAIARATFQHLANHTGDVDTIRAAAMTLHHDYTDPRTTTPKGDDQ